MLRPRLVLRLPLRSGPRAVVYAVEVAKGARKLAEWMTWAGIGSLEIKAWDWRLNHVASAYGHLALQGDTVTLARGIVESEFGSTSVMTRLSEEFDRQKLLLYFRKAIAQEVEKTVAFIHAARLHAEAQGVNRDDAVTVCLRSGLGKTAIAEYARTHGVGVVFDRGQRLSPHVSKVVRKRTSSRRPASSSAMKGDSVALTGVSACAAPRDRERQSVGLATNYTGKTITLDIEKRSDWFWLADSPDLLPRATIYFDRKDLPVDQEARDMLDSYGISVVALNEKARLSQAIPLWCSGEFARTVRRRLFRKLGTAWLTGVSHFRWVPFLYMVHAARFIVFYAYWLDFFRAHAIKVNVNNWDFSLANVPMHQAMEHIGGISVSYQWSNIEFPSVTNSSCADVLCSFGPAYRDVWEKNGSRIDSIVFSGYITDHAFDRVREKSQELRRQLQARGAQFILCYVDENSSDDRHTIIPNSVAAQSYRWFLTKILEDDTLGLILKPGYPRTLKARIGTLDGLWERAMGTGRCVMLDRGSLVTEQYPAEAAQAADLCVGLLISGTAALEAYLTGTPTVFLDLERCYWNPVYEDGHRTLVFDHLDDLDKAIAEFRESPASRTKIGNLDQWAARRDPFHDGRAASRIAQYLTWLLERLDQGSTREDALSYAYHRHVARWGGDAAIRFPRSLSSGKREERVHA